MLKISRWRLIFREKGKTLGNHGEEPKNTQKYRLSAFFFLEYSVHIKADISNNFC
jgi:hypothetical protein